MDKIIYYLPIILTILANVFYHIAQKYTSEKVNPFFSLIVTYSVALIISVIMYIFTKKGKTLSEELLEINAASIILGISVVLLEVGFLLAYRLGWNVSTSSIVSTVAVTLFLIPVGLIVFRETISGKNVVGIVFSVIGIIFMNL